MNFFTGLCLGFFWGATFVEICDKLKKKYAKKEIIENIDIDKLQSQKFKKIKEYVNNNTDNILKEN